MGLCFCPKCHNLKIRTVKFGELNGHTKYKIEKAIRENNVDSLGLSFPLNKALHRRLIKEGRGEIIFCAEDMPGRRLYIYQEGMEGSLTPNKCKPCPKYK